MQMKSQFELLIGFLWSQSLQFFKLFVLLCGGFVVVANAQDQTGAEFQSIAQSWANDAAKGAMPVGAEPLRMEIVVGNIDSRLKLAPCGNIEPYLPVGAKLWGRTRVGLRCVDGITRWNISMPVTVKAWGKAWVIKNQVPSGTPVTESNVVQTEVDWAEEANSVLIDPSLWEGHMATRVLQTGQTLRQGMVKPAQVFQAGAMVRLIAQGKGFQVSSEGQALSGGIVGQQARVRLDNGKISTGTVIDSRTVKIDL